MAAQFGRRLRKGATATTVAALVVAALSASEAPGSTSATVGERAAEATEPPGTAVTGNSPYFTDLPPLNTPNKPNKPGTSIDLPAATGPAEAGIPATVLAAYKRAEETIRDIKPGCRLPWQLLAAIGKVESGQARGGRVNANGTTLTPILGPQLNGVGFANISDTDNGAYDGDVTHDRAVGPMQFIPSTWATWGQDGNDDGRKDPNNIYDAALAAGRYLCANNRDLSVADDLEQAILGYNRSREYLRTVMSWFDYYRRGNHEVPDGSGVLPGSGEPDSHGDGSGRGGGNSRPGVPGGTTPPSNPDTSKPGKPGKPGGDGVKPPTTPPAKPPTTTPPTTTPPPTTPPPTPPPASVAALERLGSASVSATEGEKFTDRLRVRARTSAGKTVASAKVQFWIVGETAARFPGAATRVVVTTGIDGIATAPALSAGGRTGRFMVHAKALGTAAPAVDFAATVKSKPAPAPRSDALARTSDEELKARTGGSFADAVEVKATYKGKAAAGVGVTATMVTDDADKPVENDKGPYFKDADGKTVRTLTALKTDANGLLKLPEIYTDGNAGTYKLRLTTADGVVLTVELTVTAATTAPADDPSPSPSATPTA